MSSRQPRTGRAALVGLLVVLHVLVAGPAPAQAHTGLVGSSPRDGDTVSLRTDRLQLVFGEDLLPGSGQVVVRAVDGTDAATGSRPAVAGRLLEAPLDLRVTGPHVVTYRVVSVDGHAVVGEIEFEVAPAATGPGGGSAADTTAATRPDQDGLVPPVRWALVVVAALGAGAVLLSAARRMRR